MKSSETYILLLCCCFCGNMPRNMPSLIPGICSWLFFGLVIFSCLHHVTKCLSLKTEEPLTFSVPRISLSVNLRATLPPESVTPLTVEDVPFDIRFLVFQSHSQHMNVTMSYQPPPDISMSESITGTNIGLVFLLDVYSINANIYLINENKRKVTVEIDIVPYDDKAPIPGGCNMEFPVQISPFLRIVYGRINTKLEYQLAGVGYPRGLDQPSCESQATFIGYDIYMYFMKEKDYTETEYLNSIRLMTNVSSIKSNAELVNPLHIFPKTRALFLSYPGQGVIYNVIARYLGYESAYVPVATYECSFESEVDGCGQLDSLLAKILVITMGVYGVIICFLGHRLFHFQMMFFGFLASALISFVLLTKYSNMEVLQRDEWTIGIGVAGGIVWVLFWVLVKIPVLSLLLNSFILGFLLTAITLFTPLGDMMMLRNDFNYWMVVLCGILLTSIILSPNSKLLSVVSSAVVGSYVVIVMVDRLVGTVLSYIILNVVKRAVSDSSSLAWNRFPFQKNDIILSSCWGCLALIGIIVQYSLSKRHTRLTEPFVNGWRRQIAYERLHVEASVSTPIPRVVSGTHSLGESQPLLSPVDAGGSHRRYSSI